MRVRTGFTAGLVAAALCAGAATAQPQSPPSSPQGPPAGRDQACPPSSDPSLCLGYRPYGGLGRTLDPAEYPYPYQDPYLATMTAAGLSPDGVTRGAKREVVQVPVLPGRDGVPLLEGRGTASVALYRQPQRAPLMFILGGVGSNPYFGLAPYYAALFQKHGAHVVVLPSPMTWNFALAASRSATPGFTPDDARDVYQLMEATLAVLRARHGVEATSVHFMGVSLGALEGAYLSVLDADEGRIGIQQYLLVNPPPDLGYALGKLDEWLALGAVLGRERAGRAGMRARGAVEDYIEDRRTNRHATFDRAAEVFSSMSKEELQFVIAQYIRLVLPELVYVTQAVGEQRVPATKQEARARLREAKAFTLRAYEERIAVPRRQQVEPGVTAESLHARGSLRPILDRLRANPRVHIMHNADDVLADRAAIEELKAAMGEQMTLYPYGGHLGNLWFAHNQEDILRYFQGPTVGRSLSSGAPPSGAPSAGPGAATGRSAQAVGVAAGR